MIRVGVVGVGIAGRSHLLDVVTSQAMEVAAVCARTAASAEAVANDFGVPAAFSGISSMLAKVELDAVVVATPNRVLAEHVDQALTKGLIVLAEKPLALSGRAIDRLEAHSAARMSIAYTRRYRAGVRAAKNWLQSGRIGALREVRATWQEPYGAWYAPDAQTHRADPAQRAGGTLADSGSHALDTLLFLTGALGKVREIELELNENRADIGGRLLLDGRSPAQLIWRSSDDASKRIELLGTKGMIAVRENEALLDAGEDQERVEETYLARPVDDIQRLASGEAPLGASLDEAIVTSRTIMAAYASAGHTLWAPWIRPRAKALARRSGAC